MTTPTLMKDGRTISGLFLPVQFLMSSVSLSFSFITQAVRFEIIAFGYVVFVSPLGFLRECSFGVVMVLD